jgi:preprotein translocase subunit SecE
MEKIRAMFKEYSDELMHKVHWPTAAELQGSTITVLVASLLIAVIIYVMDLGFGSIMKLVYGLF